MKQALLPCYQDATSLILPSIDVAIRPVSPFDLEENKKGLRDELKRLVIPVRAWNARTKFCHNVDANLSMGREPKAWLTKCGWKFMTLRESRLLYEDEALADGLRWCTKCDG